MTFWLGFLLGASANALFVILFTQWQNWKGSKRVIDRHSPGLRLPATAGQKASTTNNKKART